MNKYSIILIVFLFQVSGLYAQKQLKNNLIVKGSIPAISLVDQGQSLIFAQKNKVYHWLRSTNKISDSIDFHTSGKIIALDYNSQTKLVVAGFQSGELFISNLNGKAERLQMRGGSIISVKFSNDGNYLAVGTADSNLSMWDVSNRRLLWSKKGHNDHILSICFSSSDSILFSGSADKRIGIWNLQKGVVSGYLTESGSWIRKLAVSKAKGTLFAATDEGAIYSWKIDGANVKFAGKIKESLSWSLALAVGGDDGIFVSGFKNGSLVFRTKFGNYYTNFGQPVVDVAMFSENDYVSFYVSVLNRGLYFVDLADNAFKLSAQ